MSDIIEIRPPEVIAAEINSIKRSTAQFVLLQSIEIGRLLCEAKQAVNHGEWGGWLEANFAYSTSTANNLMRIYTEYGEDSQISFFETNKLELYGNLSRSQAVALLALPSDEREEFVRENDVGSMSVSELEEAIKKAKEESASEIRAKEEEIKKLENDLKKKDSEASKAEAKNKRLEKELETSRENAEKLERIRQERDKLNLQIAELEKKPAEITDEQRSQLAAEIRAETDKEIEQLKMMNAKLEAASNPVAQKFSAYFEAFQDAFNKMRKVLEEADPEINSKLKGALNMMLGKMKDAIKEEAR